MQHEDIAHEHAEDLSGWRRALLFPLALPLRLWSRTIRFDLDPEDLKAATYCEAPVAIVLWHNRLFLASEFFRRFRTKRMVYAIISSSKDGAWLRAFFSFVGMAAIRGSSSKHGREAATAMVDVMKGGHDIGITPDGPRGPCYEVKGGTLIVTRRTKSDLVVWGAEFRSAWRLKSWDKFYVPVPFSSVRIRAKVVRYTDLPEDRGQATAALKAQLIALNPDPGSATPATARTDRM